MELLTVALLGDKLMEISEVPSGLSCNCNCPECHGRLIAKKGAIKVHHFAHENTECKYAVESAVHLLCKDVLKETKTLYVPDYSKGSFFKKGSEIVFDEVIIEEPLATLRTKIRPDAICVKNGRKLLVEFANTHFIDDCKLSKIKEIGLPCIEIDISRQTAVREYLMRLLNSQNSWAYWMHNPKLKAEYLADQRKKMNEYLAGKLERLKKYEKDLAGFAKHNEVIRKIISGDRYEYWNGKIYGQGDSYETYVFVSGKRVTVYGNKLLFAGLNRVREYWRETLDKK